MLQSNGRGAGRFITVASVIAVLLVVGGGFYIYSMNQQVATVPPSELLGAEDRGIVLPEAGAAQEGQVETFADSQSGISFDYPVLWKQFMREPVTTGSANAALFRALTADQVSALQGCAGCSAKFDQTSQRWTLWRNDKTVITTISENKRKAFVLPLDGSAGCGTSLVGVPLQGDRMAVTVMDICTDIVDETAAQGLSRETLLQGLPAVLKSLQI